MVISIDGTYGRTLNAIVILSALPCLGDRSAGRHRALTKLGDPLVFSPDGLTMVRDEDQRAGVRVATVVVVIVIGSSGEDRILGHASRLPAVVRHLHHRVQVFYPVAHHTLRPTTISPAVVIEQEVSAGERLAIGPSVL